VSDPVPANPQPAAAKPRNLWQRRISDPIIAQLTQGLTPHKIALTIAIGSAIAMFPIFGTTTLICLLVGIVMRLNQPIMQAVNYACTPLHVVFIPFCFHWGERLFSVRHSGIEWRHLRGLLPQSWSEIVEDPSHVFHNLLQIVHDYSGIALHAIVLWVILVPFWATTVYHVVLPIMRGIERVRVANAAEKNKEHPVP
jgi:uncharacterized protein (DUF2062 family)